MKPTLRFWGWKKLTQLRISSTSRKLLRRLCIIINFRSCFTTLGSFICRSICLDLVSVCHLNYISRYAVDHPLDKLIQLIQSPCIEEQSCNFFGRKTDHGMNPSRPPPSPTSPSGPSPVKATSRDFLFGKMDKYGRTSSPPPPSPTSAPLTKEVSITMAWYGRAARPPPPPPTSAPPTKEGSFTMAGCGRAASQPPPSPTSAPPTKEKSFTMAGYGRATSPPPPSPTSAPPTKETSFTMARNARAWTLPPPPPKSSPPTHQVSSNGLLLEKSPPNPSLASTWADIKYRTMLIRVTKQIYSFPNAESALLAVVPLGFINESSKSMAFKICTSSLVGFSIMMRQSDIVAFVSVSP